MVFITMVGAGSTRERFGIAQSAKPALLESEQ